MNKLQKVNLVDFELCLVNGMDTVNVRFNGDYPLRIGNHFVVVTSYKDNRSMHCPLCSSSVTVSETVWRNLTSAKRRRFVKYGFGKFFSESCSDPKEMKDIFDGVTDRYIGDVNDSETQRSIEQELKHNLLIDE